MARFAGIFSGLDRDTQPRADFFFSEDLRLRRHDYHVNIAGGFAASQLTSDYVMADGLHLPTKRRAYTRGLDRRPIIDMQMVTIDVSDVCFS